MSPRVGEILVDLRACDLGRVREGLESQVLFGGRLGTNLLELGAVTEEALARALARRHGTRSAHGEVRLEPALLALLRPEHADRFEVVPYALSGRRLSVLCRDPSDLRRLDELAFVLGKQIEPVVVPEARLWALLRLHYGVERPMRGIEVDWTRQRRALPLEPEPPPAGPDLMDEAEFQAMYADRVTGPATKVTATATSTPTANPTATGGSVRPERSASSAGAESKGEAALPRPRPPPLPAKRPPPPAEPADPFSGALVSDDELLASLQAEASAAHPQRHEGRIALGSTYEPEAAALGYAEAVAALAGVADRSAIARVVLRYACSRFRRVVLLTVHARGADGWEGLGEGLTPQTVARMHVPLGKPGVVQTVVESRSHFLGPLPRTDANIRLLRALGGGAPKTSFAMPVLARGRVVNVLYADGGRGGYVNPDAVGELLILAARISQSYDVLLRRAS